MYSESVTDSIFQPYSEISLKTFSYNLNENIQELKAIVIKIFGNLKNLNLFTRNFHFLIKLQRRKENLGCLFLLKVIPTDISNLFSKRL